MQKKTIMMMAVVGCAAGILTGCGIPEEEHNAIVTELKAENQEMVDQLNGKMADMDSLLKSEKAKARKSRIELDNASEQIKSYKAMEAKASKALADEKAATAKLSRELKSAKSAASAAQDDANAKSDMLAEAKAELEAVTKRFDQFRKNMSALNSMSTAPATMDAAPAAMEKKETMEAAPMFEEVPAETAPSGGISALDILNQMSTK